ncbi:unnamed protein product [Bursaphelenchus xylophilus]|nr:unnamed protein product [Bursaphelenchus xylophilus]CAG9122536.1 unnamed protein product [Bursaphelenchus xylophilus]
MRKVLNCPFGRRLCSSKASDHDHELTTSTFNVMTGAKGTIRLTERRDIRPKKIPRIYSLPSEALNGFYNVLQGSERIPKQLQHEADQLTNKIIHRKMPADPEEVRLARKTNNMRHYKWRPMAFQTREECAGYALSRLPGNYAEAKFVLDQLDLDDFSPESILDYGSGIGGVFWAAREKWDNSLRDYCCVDPNVEMNHLAMDIMRGPDSKLIAPYVNFRRTMVPSPRVTYDIVVAQRVLPELPSSNSRIDLISMLWSKTNKYLILIESNLLDSFTSLMNIRDFVLTAGFNFDIPGLAKKLKIEGKLDAETDEILRDRRASPYEKYCLLKKKIQISTEIAPGHVFAPCPHDSGCPLSTGRGYSEPCAFEAKIPEIRVDGKTRSKHEDRTLRSKFTYLILKKGERTVGQKALPRILKINHCGKHVQCKACTAFDGLQRFTVSRKDGHVFNRIRTVKEGHLLPFHDEIVKSQDENIDFINQIYEEEKAQLQ